MVIIKYEHFSNKSKTLLLESDSLLLSNASSSKISPTYSKIIDSTDLGSLIGNTQCGNFRIFLRLRFYVKTILVFPEFQKLQFLRF